MEEETLPNMLLHKLPDNDHGKVRERRDFDPLDIPLRPILANPHRDFSFTDMTGWRYYPTTYKEDRLAITLPKTEIPSTRMILPASWAPEEKAAPMQKLELQLVEQRTMQVDPPTLPVKRQPPDFDRTALEKLPRLQEAAGQQRLGDQVSTRVANHFDANTSPPISADPSSTTKSSTMSLLTTDSMELEVTTTKTNHVTQPIVVQQQQQQQQQPILQRHADPDKAPMDLLYAFYGSKPRKHQIAPDDYLTWSNEKIPSELRYTSAFICPITKEIFLSGHYGNKCEPDGLICWYPKKSLAQHAAAARAWDCWNLREGRDKVQERLCLLPTEPYQIQDAPELPLHQFPDTVREKLEEAIKLCKEREHPRILVAVEKGTAGKRSEGSGHDRGGGSATTRGYTSGFIDGSGARTGAGVSSGDSRPTNSSMDQKASRHKSPYRSSYSYRQNNFTQAAAKGWERNGQYGGTRKGGNEGMSRLRTGMDWDSASDPCQSNQERHRDPHSSSRSHPCPHGRYERANSFRHGRQDHRGYHPEEQMGHGENYRGRNLSPQRWIGQQHHPTNPSREEGAYNAARRRPNNSSLFHNEKW